MLNHKGIQLINVHSSGIDIEIYQKATVEYIPEQKYKIDKQNPVAPEITWRTGKYKADKLQIALAIYPHQIFTLLNMLRDSTQLHIQYNHNNELKSFPVLLEQLTPIPNEGRKHIFEYDFELKIEHSKTPLGQVEFILESDEIVVL